MTTNSRKGGRRLRYHYDFICIILKIVGVSFDDEPTWYKIYGNIIVYTNLFYVTVFQYGTLYLSRDNTELVTKLLFYTFGASVGAIRMVLLILQRDKVRGLFALLKETSDELRNNTTEEEVIKEVTQHRNRMIIILCIAYIPCFLNILPILYARLTNDDPSKWLFQYGEITIVNARQSPEYELVLLYQTYATSISGGFFVTTDLLIGSIHTEIAHQFALVYKQFENIGNNLKKASTDEHNQFRSIISKAVTNHVKVFNNTKELEEAFYATMQVGLLGFILTLSVDVYQLTMMEQSVVQMLRDLGIAACVLLGFFTVCLGAEEARINSVLVASACFEACFSIPNTCFQRQLVLVMRRCCKPVRFTAGKLAELSLGLFMTVLKSTYSLFMILHRRQKQLHK